jgi:hypothetical protein
MLVAGWLAGIVGNLVSMGGYLDVAARDALLAVGALALSRMPDDARQARMPSAALPRRQMRIDPVGTVPRSVH